jgi:thioredoxin-related protein
MKSRLLDRTARIAFVAALWVVVGCTGHAVSVAPDWGTDLDAAQKQARETGRPILVDFTGSDWCGWCIKLDREVFSQAAFKSYATNNLVLLMLDFPRTKPQTDAVKKLNASLAEKYGVEGFPTILLLDATGRELGRTGYQPGGPDAYVAHLKDLLKDVKPPAAAKPNP